MNDAWLHLTETLDLARLYSAAPLAVDGIIYLVLMTGVARVTLSRRFEGRGGAAITGAVGLALACSLVVAEWQTGFRLADLAGFAWIVVLCVLGLMFFDLARHAGIPGSTAAALGVVAVLFVSETAAASLWAMPALAPWRDLVLLVGAGAIVMLAVQGTSAIGGRWRGSANGQHRWESPSHDAQDTASDDAIEATQQVEESILRMLERLLDEVRREGIAKHTARKLHQIRQRQRLLHEVYGSLLRRLARLNWKSKPDRMRLTRELSALLAAAKDNLSEFDRALELAVFALDGSNVELLMKALERSILFEEKAHLLAAQLREHLFELHRVS